MIVKKYSGFSLIELMVAMLIGLFLIFVVISSYFSSKTSYTLRTELGELESNARIAMAFLKDGIEHAGYPSTYVHTINKPFLTAADMVGGVKGFVCGTDSDGLGFVSLQEATYINNNNRYTKDSGTRDRISIAFMPDNPADTDAVYWQDCAGTYADIDPATRCSADPVAGQGSSATVYNSYFVTSVGNGEYELKCTSSRNITVPIARGIEHIQFRYGVRVSGNVVYKTATDVESDGVWTNVVSVHVAMLVRSTNEVKSKDESIKYMLLDREIEKDDRYLRKVYTSLIHLPNRDR